MGIRDFADSCCAIPARRTTPEDNPSRIHFAASLTGARWKRGSYSPRHPLHLRSFVDRMRDQPRWGYAYEDVKRRGLDLVFAVDTSRSMLSNDVSPNRLARVKLATQDLINDLTGDRIGLIAFAGRAFLQAPLTIDYDAAVESINDLDTKTIPEGGTNISEAIALAVQTFGKTATGNRALIIFTDGEELSGNAVKEAKTAADAGIRIFTVGVGTAQGSLIPIESENGSAFVKDAKGQVVKSRLDENRLREIAQATGLSMRASSYVRAGKAPHPRHWEALHRLATATHPSLSE